MLKVYRSDKSAIMPTRANEHDAGVDLYAKEFVVIPPKEVVRVYTGLHVAIRNNYVGLIMPRSSLSTYHGVVLANTVGVIDSGYRGEIIVALYNSKGNPYSLCKGDRFAQMLIMPVSLTKVSEVFSLEDLGDTDRGHGGFGSTGV